MKWIIAAALLATLVYVMIRPWLKEQPWASKFFTLVEPIEIALYKKSETILFARLKIVTGLLVTLLTQLGTVDLSMVTPLLPEKHRVWFQMVLSFAPLALTVVGLLDEKLRYTTTKPVELVALPENKPLPPAVVEAVAAADVAKKEAVAVVKSEKV
jgi:hypothetical protein